MSSSNDLFVEDTIVVDLKAIKNLEDIHFAIVRSQLKAVGKQHGLLLNIAKTMLEPKLSHCCLSQFLLSSRLPHAVSASATARERNRFNKHVQPETVRIAPGFHQPTPALSRRERELVSFSSATKPPEIVVRRNAVFTGSARCYLSVGESKRNPLTHMLFEWWVSPTLL